MLHEAPAALECSGAIQTLVGWVVKRIWHMSCELSKVLLVVIAEIELSKKM